MDLPLDAASNPASPDDLLPASSLQLTVSKESGRKYYCSCKQRMNTKTIDSHLFCVKCQGHDCDFDS